MSHSLSWVTPWSRATALALILSGCSGLQSGPESDFDIAALVNTDPRNFRVTGIAPRGFAFTGDGEFHLRVLLPNDMVINENYYVLREVARQDVPDRNARKIDFGLRPADQAAFHLQQSALKSSMVAGFVNLESDDTVVGICTTGEIAEADAIFRLLWRDGERNLTISDTTLSLRDLLQVPGIEFKPCAR